MGDFGSAVTDDGASIAWSAMGSGDAVVLVPGQAVTSGSWDGVVADLADRFRVITFDQRGIGVSTEGSDPPETTRGFARDVARVLESAGATRGHVVGHSMGGRVAQWLAIDRPDVVGALVLIATTGGDAAGFARSAEASADLASADAARLSVRFFSDEYLRTHPTAVDVFVRKEGSVRTRRRAYVASSTHDAWANLGSIRSPTLVVHGDADTITPVENGRALAEAIPRAEYLEVHGGRHAPHLDHPNVVEAVVTFLTRHPLSNA
ncbi:pimeloyl-ACP methyl ester carboxylesterase [Microbacterium trichothecenolyticum]|uniref:alpha/beta fold hydrolase n=1 Tax=Microbacterium trichothecenolyticum TaxID=69370 RepID=UPI0028572534|nr:alpha/beta fold hydrolase [Microbacterium trichothecenolyticum]MDR7184404.1 pimeloyl-ACP methyl ester carboxylesterase [Microbacterium trichothecenolyticum]